MELRNETAKANLFVVDDDRSIRDSLTTVLEAAGFGVHSYSSAKDLLAEFDRENAAHCVIADVCMPEMSGLELVKVLTQKASGMPVVLITGHGDIPMAVEAMKAGAADFIEKPFTVDEILRAVGSALGQGAGESPSRTGNDVNQKFQSLTPRERETLELLVLGHTNKSAAHQLAISPRTVEVYRAKIMEKMGARSLAELVRMSMSLTR